MRKRCFRAFISVIAASILLLLAGVAATAAPFFSTGDLDGKMATASRPASAGKIEIEAADDFILGTSAVINSATFTGLITGTGSTIGKVDVEIYRVFPNDSNVGRTSGPPTFSTASVPTRVNSPADDALATRDSSLGSLTFTTTILDNSFTAANSVLNGINPKPGQTTGGEGAVTGREVLFTANFITPFSLPPDHYFFVPQVEVSGGEFYWLSAVRPIVAPGTPFLPDLQSWIRNANLDPDWLRVGTDIVGGATPPTFNAAFTLTGTVPEPASIILLASGVFLVALKRKSLDSRPRN